VFYLTLITWIYITVFKASSTNLALTQFTIIAKFRVTGVTLAGVTARNIIADMLTWTA
jgi:hypothetical protein